uniref:Cystatin domain-containing protein n=1 Tax=Panagrolaimus sp. PS1159 TaxID=55785 RepID=A0AC35FE35_9BILA
MFLLILFFVSSVAAINENLFQGVDPDHNHLKGPINDKDYIMDIIKKYNTESNDPYYDVPTKIMVSGVEHVGKEYLYRFTVTFTKIPCLKTEFDYHHFDNCYESISHDISPTDLPTK